MSEFRIRVSTAMRKRVKLAVSRASCFVLSPLLGSSGSLIGKETLWVMATMRQVAFQITLLGSGQNSNQPSYRPSCVDHPDLLVRCLSGDVVPVRDCWRDLSQQGDTCRHVGSFLGNYIEW